MDNQLNNDVLIKKPKNFDSNKLINPDIEVDEDLEEEEELIDETIDEMDDETLEIINRIRMKNINNDNLFFQEKPETKSSNKASKKGSKKSSKKTLSLQEFTKITPSESKPVIKKFTSTRVESKKKPNETFVKRQFNPRKPPYNFNRSVVRENIIELNNKKEFPELN